jgi:hypothetical protein
MAERRAAETAVDSRSIPTLAPMESTPDAVGSGGDTAASDTASAGVLQTQSLMEDGSFGLHVDPAVEHAVAPWRPRLPPFPAPLRPGAAALVVERGPVERDLPSAPPLLEMRRLRGWMLPSGGHALLADPEGHLSARVDLAGLTATVRIPDPIAAATHAAVEIFAALSISSALLLNRQRRALVHAAAVVPPGGRALLLAGGTFSGKTTTCLNLVRLGWEWLSDDHVVLAEGEDGGIAVAGWPRRFNLDTGAPGAPAGTRRRADASATELGHWRPTSPAGALVFPSIDPDLPTLLEPLHPAAALGRLLDQSPWLLADREAARPVLTLFQSVAKLPAFTLRMGLDCHRDPGVLGAALRPAAAAARGAVGTG